MLFAVVLSVIFVICEVHGGYVYPKPSIAFELPHYQPLSHHTNPVRQTSSDEYVNEISYSVGHGDYSYLQQHGKNKIHEIFFSSDNAVHPAQQNRIISTHQDLTSLEPMTTELNANIDASTSVQSATVQNPALTEQNHINVQQILDIENDAQLIRNHQSTQVLPKGFKNNGFQVLNSIDPQNIDDKLLNCPETFFKNQNMASSINLHDNMQSRGENAKPLSAVHSLSAEHNHQTQHSQSSLQTVVDMRRPNVRPVLNLQQALSVQNNIGTQFSAPQISQDPHIVSDINLGSVSSIENSVLMQSNIIQNIDNQKLNVQNNVVPVITKQVSFHIPPPDIEEPSVVRNIQPPTRVYKILFIKLPSQETKNRIQQSVIEKTIIYVLSKTPEPARADVTQQKVSDHEVFFVKYKGNPNYSEA
ncbi:unnamed protein product, partial [Brenthis ino]